jgi:tetratricopeptide (TPR) repeat protein
MIKRRRLIETRWPSAEDRRHTTIGLAWLYTKRSNYEKAAELFAELKDAATQAWGATHVRTAEAIHSLAEVYVQMGRLHEAESLCNQALGIREAAGDPSLWASLTMMHDIAGLYADQGRLEDAARLLRHWLALPVGADADSGQTRADTLGVLLHIYMRTAGPIWGDDDLRAATAADDLARLYGQMGRLDEAIAFYRRALDVRHRVLGDEAEATVQTISGLIDIYMQIGNGDEADELYRRIKPRDREIADAEE